MINTIASVSMAILLSACASRMPNTASYEIRAAAYAPEDIIVVKGNASECDRIYGEIVGVEAYKSFKNMAFKPEEKLSCVFMPEGIVPGEFQIEYGELLSKDHKNRENVEIQKNLNSYLSEITWKKITLNPNELVEKYKKQVPTYPEKVKRRYSEGKKLNYLIQLNPDGSYVVEDRLEWMHPRIKKKEKRPSLIFAIFYGFGPMQ
ncbi:hypothetical protein [Acinetobacter indicus]|uniref:hypothetical protein n=2 Tax=Acinetobacter indicus TaxID=756892 RepID=UPI002577387F|nr:hypothetical protein [Acinetobacter indicus]MDM1243646.1 hypothetical protein [Acinetobacter indicus]MDM1287525.1 hypothetical protein [Acinetobacter indicus]